MLISIIIPIYNYAHVIARAIESVLTQHDASFELIIIDDGSTDNTTAVAESYTKKMANVIYIRQENNGAASARNQGARVSKGDYLLFLDADDELLPGALAAFRRFIALHPEAEMIAAGHTSIEANGKQRAHHFNALSDNALVNFSGYIRKKYRFSNGAMLFHRRVFQTLTYPEYLRSNEDIPIFAQTLALFKCMSFPEPVLAVHKHDDSLRNQVQVNVSVGLQVVDAVFDAEVLPAVFMQFKQEFYARRCLGLFRALYLAGKPIEARLYYRKAIVAYPRSILVFSYLKKYLFSFFR